MTVINFQVIIVNDAGQWVSRMTRPADTALFAILADALAEHRLAGGTAEWVVRCTGVLLGWEQRLQDILVAFKEPLALVVQARSYAIPGPRAAVVVPPPASPPPIPPPGAPSGVGQPPPKEQDIFADADIPRKDEEGSEVVSFDVETDDFDRVLGPETPFADLECPSGISLENPEDSEVVALDEDVDEEEADILVRRRVSRAALEEPPRQVERRATVRYYSRMNPERLFPLLVVLSRKSIQKVVKKAVKQAESAGFRVTEGSVVEVEPILPGCNVYPPREPVTIEKSVAQATFWVVPYVLGRVQHARVVVRQDGRVLAEVPLQVKVVKQTAAIVAGVLSLVLPYASKAAEHFGLDWTTQQQQGFALYWWLARAVLGVLRPEVLGLGLLLLTAALYLAMRPRKREVFWDIEPVS